MKNKERVHHIMTGEEQQIRMMSHAKFQGRARCGYGEPLYRIKSTLDKGKVTCPECLKRI